MNPEIVSGLITASATILAAIIGGWVAIRIKRQELSKSNETREIPIIQSWFASTFWIIFGAIIGGGLVYAFFHFVILPAIPTEREIPLTSIIPVSASVGNEIFRVGDFVDYKGNQYNECFWARAPSEIRFDLKGSFTTFEVKGLFHDYGDCDTYCDDGAQFIVFLDDVEKYRSPTMFVTSNPVDIKIDVTYGHELVLVTDDGALDNNCCDWTIWCSAILR